MNWKAWAEEDIRRVIAICRMEPDGNFTFTLYARRLDGLLAALRYSSFDSFDEGAGAGKLEAQLWGEDVFFAFVHDPEQGVVYRPPPHTMAGSLSLLTLENLLVEEVARRSEGAPEPRVTPGGIYLPERKLP